MNTAFWSATKLAQALRTKKIGAVEMLGWTLEQMKINLDRGLGAAGEDAA